MHHSTANEDPRLLLWTRVRDYAVPPSMIESATARRTAGDWAGACAAARVGVDLDLQAAAHLYGHRVAEQLRDDLRHLAPDLLRWHFPRIAPDGLLRPGLTVSLARYPTAGGALHLVARTPPAWASAGQRFSLALWDPARPRDGIGAHPHPRPDRRFRLDLHRHLWDARRAGELRERASASGDRAAEQCAAGLGLAGQGFAVGRWGSEAALLLRADGCADDVVAVRLDARRTVLLEPDGPRLVPTRPHPGPVLPDAATRVPPDVELLDAGLVDPGRLHPLVASALAPDHPVTTQNPATTTGSRLVDCRGSTHRIGVVDGVLVPLDHDPDEIHREELLAALGGPPLPCLREIDLAHRNPESFEDVRARLDHGDTAGALAVVEGLLGPDALLRAGALRDELEAAARHRVLHGLYRAGLTFDRPKLLADRFASPSDSRPRRVRYRSRYAFSR